MPVGKDYKYSMERITASRFPCLLGGVNSARIQYAINLITYLAHSSM